MEQERLLIRAAVETDAEAIALIYNQGISSRQATFESEPRSPSERRQWIAQHDARDPILVAALDARVMGWAAISAYRARACYRGVGEYSIYIHEGARGLGVGRRLLGALVEAAARQGYWKLLSRIFPENEASRALCRACGFREVGVYAKHARLDGVWRDVIIVERLIPENLT